MTRMRSAAGILSLVLLGGVLAACTSTSPNASSSAIPTGSASAASAQTVSVPLNSTIDQGTPRLTTQITVGGGSPITVVIDTGSTGLFIAQGAGGSGIVPNGQTYTENYVSSSLKTTLATATVSIGAVSTARPMVLGIVDTTTTQGIFGNAQGIMGVAPADGAAAGAGLLSPFVQLTAPYDQGFEIDAATSGAGTLTLGAPSSTAGTVFLALTAIAAPSGAAAGTTFWAKDVTMCWTLGSAASACGPTDLDSGSPETILNTTVASGVPVSNGVVQSGTSVSVASPSGSALWSFTAGTTAAADKVVTEALGSETSYNTGIAFYYQHVVAFDWSSGQLLVSPKP